MLIKTLLRYVATINKFKNQRISTTHLQNQIRFFYISSINYDNKKSVIIRDPFEEIKEKNRKNYLEMIYIFINQENVYRRGHVEFIYAAMKHMEEFGVEKDLEVYKALIEVLPKGKFIPENIIQAEFMHYPKQQKCVVDLLDQMEDYGVMPDFDMEDQLLSVFGKRGLPLKKFWRMMYWLPKFKNLSPFPLPDPLPDSTLELAKLAIERISKVDVSNTITTYYTADIKDSIDNDTWIVSAQSTIQKKLLSENKPQEPVFVEGPFKVWLKGRPINYFILRGQTRLVDDDDFENPDNVDKIEIPYFNFGPPIKTLLKCVPTVHEQEDGVVYALCATGTSSRDSLLSWIRHLETDNPLLCDLPVVFTLRSGVKDVVNINSSKEYVNKIEGKE